MEEDKAIVKVIASPLSKKPAKKRGPISLLRAAVYMFQRRSNRKQAPTTVDVASNAMKLVGSMRPLHLQDCKSPQAPPGLHVSVSMDNFQDVFQQPMSPTDDAPARGSIGGMSHYASAQNLQELDRSDDVQLWSEGGGDEMIDVKAKEFIAQFYEQIKLERLRSFNNAEAMHAKASTYVPRPSSLFSRFFLSIIDSNIFPYFLRQQCGGMNECEWELSVNRLMRLKKYEEEEIRDEMKQAKI